MDLVWLVIPAAVGLFVLRTLLIARKLKLAARTSGVADLRALREAQARLGVHRDHLAQARAAPGAHLAAAKRLSRSSVARAPTGVDAMVENFLPERRL